MEAQQLIVFSTGEKEYGIDISKISSIEDGSMNFYKIPGAPEYFEGIVNLRNKAHAVVNLRKRLKLDGRDIDENTRVIMAKTQSDTCGIIVDEVREIKAFEDSASDPDRAALTEEESCFVRSIRKIDDRTILVIDPELLLAV